MGIKVRFEGGPRAGKVLEFGGDVQRINIGRDETCEVSFPAEMTSVGHRHCTLEQVGGRYRLVINQTNPVLISGKRVQSSMELTSPVDLQLGRGGPLLKVEPDTSSGLPKTDDASRLEGTGTRLGKLNRSSKRTRNLVLVALLLLATTAGVGYQVKKGLDAEIGKLNQAQQALVAKLADQLAVINTRVDELKPSFEKTFDQVAPAVYLVMKDDGHGNLDPQATAWVVDNENKILATNGHVAAMYETLNKGETLVVRSAVPKVADFIVTGVKIHPGFGQFREAWSRYDPVVKHSETQAQEVRPPGQACDVGLLYVKGDGELGARLPLANHDTFPEMNRGYPICFAGYSMEGLVLDGVTLSKPDMTTHTAYIVSTTDYFGIPDGDIDNRQLIKHALPVAGGASGSPILNSKGEVLAVLSGGNMIGSTSEARISSGANINFAQRIDLIEELLHSTAESRQQSRTITWNAQLKQLYERRSKAGPAAQLAQAIHWQRDVWQRHLAADGAFQVTLGEVDHFAGPLAVEIEGGSKILRHTFELPAGKYLLSATTGSDVELSLRGTATRDGTQFGSSQAPENVVDPQFGTEPKWSRGIPISLKGPAQLEACAMSSSNAASVLLQLDRAELTPLGKDQRLAAIVKSWNQIVDDSSSTSKRPTIVNQPADARRIEQANEVKLIGDTLEPGRYLAVAIPSSDVDINLWMGRAVGDKPVADDAPLVNDSSPNFWAHGSFTLQEKTPVQALIFRPAADIDVEFILYRAE